MTCCGIWKEFDEENNLIKEYKYWKLLVRNRNKTLGNCVAILKRHVEKFSEIREEEMKDFVNVVQDTEKSIKESFDCDKFNYQMTMMKDPHLHFHIFPRYSSNKNFAEIEWVDEGWPGIPGKSFPKVSQEILNRIKEEIKKKIK